MWSKEEAKELKINFWNGFKRYCSKHKIYRKWVLTGVKIKSTQLKFYADEQKALVLFQIDHKNDLRRYEIYECFQSYRKLMAADCGEDLHWDEDYLGIPRTGIKYMLSSLKKCRYWNKLTGNTAI